MTAYDPEFYSGPWPAAPRRLEREPSENYTFFDWSSLFSGITEGICAPINEVEGYNEGFRDVAVAPEH